MKWSISWEAERMTDDDIVMSCTPAIIQNMTDGWRSTHWKIAYPSTANRWMIVVAGDRPVVLLPSIGQQELECVRGIFSEFDIEVNIRSILIIAATYASVWIRHTFGNSIKLNKSSSGDEIPERDATYHLICLLIYHRTPTHLYFHNIFLSRPNTYPLHI